MSRDLPPLETWPVGPLPGDVAQAIDRLRRAADVRRVAIMPDVHLAGDVCVGTVLATGRLIYPQAVGGDIGCGILAVPFDTPASALADASVAGRVLGVLGRRIPALRRHRSAVVPLPEDLRDARLSHGALESVRREEGTLQFATLGCGNHFVELQSDEEDRLWLMLHSGSRAMGQAIRAHHLARASPAGSGLLALDAESELGSNYLRDVRWARRYADANRRSMARCVAEVLAAELGAACHEDRSISVDHNHVVVETHDGTSLLVHRKGAMPAPAGAAGLLPGSMGTTSFHVEGRGCVRSLCSSAHGAGRALSRRVAARAVSERDVHRQMHGVWYDHRMAKALREEAPSAYKDVRAVLRAQTDLVKVTRVLRPVLNYKGR